MTPLRCSLVPRPSYTAADGLHHRYVKRGSGVLLYKFLSRRPGMLGHQSDSRHAIIAYLSYCLKLFVTDDNVGCSASCLRQRMGYFTLKDEQLRMVADVLGGRDGFVCLPTGYGKSLCYAIFVGLLDGRKALTDRIRIQISYPNGQRIGFSFVTLTIQIDVPKSEQIRIIARPIRC